MDDYPDNPFRGIVVKYFEDLQDIEFKSPYFAQFIHATILVFLIILLSICYLVFGVPTQIAVMLGKAAKDSYENIDEADNPIEATPHWVAAGTFVIIAIPFAALVSPVALVGLALYVVQKLVSPFLQQIYDFVLEFVTR